jgi:hypothetical protein
VRLVADAKFPAVVGLLEKRTRHQAKKEEQWCEVANEQPYVDLGNDDEWSHRGVVDVAYTALAPVGIPEATFGT